MMEGFLQALHAVDPAATFARADIDGSGHLTFDEWQLAFGGEEGVETDVLRALFDEFDADQNGCVSLAEFQAGLKTVRPLATGLDVMKKTSCAASGSKTLLLPASP